MSTDRDFANMLNQHTSRKDSTMPYKSDSQRRFFHSPGAKKAGISKATVDEYDKASKGKKLPEKSPWERIKTKKGY